VLLGEEIMRKVILLFSFLFLMSSSTISQEIIKYPEKPLSKSAGRVMKLKEELRITDEDGDFYFKEPREVKVAANGFIFVREKDMLYKFDENGKFLKNILKSGEGPGEILELGSFVLNRDEIMLFCGMRNKIVKADMDGNLKKDIKLGTKRFYRLLSYHSERYFMIDYERKSYERKTGIVDINHALFTVDEEGVFSPTPHSFATKQAMTVFTRRGRGGVAITPITRIHIAKVLPKVLYLSHTQDYLIKLFDLDKGQVIKMFMRKYKKVKRESQESIEMLMSEYCNDVQKLLVHKDKLWVFTSTYNEKKGILVDVFSSEGEYLDNFYLPLFKVKKENLEFWPITMDGDFLFVLEINEDETLAIVKYEIVG
jgi:hypothetical protein